MLVKRMDRAGEARAQHQCALERPREVLLRAVDPRRECESVNETLYSVDNS
jgi:hypothetical protein